MRPSRPILDPGWLFLLCGLALLGASVLVPAQADLLEARALRRRAAVIAAHRQERLDRYQEYLTALEKKDPALVMSLAASQLNQIPADRRPLSAWPDQRPFAASVFPALEPPPAALPQTRRLDSWLARLATGPGQLWLVGVGGVLVLAGLLPWARPRAMALA